MDDFQYARITLTETTQRNIFSIVMQSDTKSINKNLIIHKPSKYKQGNIISYTRQHGISVNKIR